MAHDLRTRNSRRSSTTSLRKKLNVWFVGMSESKRDRAYGRNWRFPQALRQPARTHMRFSGVCERLAARSGWLFECVDCLCWLYSFGCVID